MSGFRAILWKETREQYLRGGRPTVSLVIMGLLDLVVGVGVPIAVAQGTHDRVFFLAGCATVAGLALALACLALPISVVVDAVAGERERHTLETLLASPASDRDIVLGKAVAILSFVAAQAVTLGFLCTVTWTAFAGKLGLVAGLGFLVGGLLVGLLVASYTTGLGLLISQRARSVKSGQQMLAYAMMPFFLLPSLIGSWVARMARGHPPAFVLLVGGAVAATVFVALNALFWGLALTRFQRGRLLTR